MAPNQPGTLFTVALGLLFLLWAAFLLGGMAYGKLSADRTRLMPRWMPMCSSAALLVAAWLWYAWAAPSAASLYALLIAIGMTFGFTGDLFMARLLPAPNRAVGGMAAFGLGHGAYIAAFLWFGDRFGFAQATARYGAWGIWLLIGLALWYAVIFRGNKPTLLHWVALPYALLLISTAGLALGLALQMRAFIPSAIGGALFFASDLILAAGLFNKRHFYLSNDVIWLTYGPAQMLLVYAMMGL